MHDTDTTPSNNSRAFKVVFISPPLASVTTNAKLEEGALVTVFVEQHPLAHSFFGAGADFDSVEQHPLEHSFFGAGADFNVVEQHPLAHSFFGAGADFNVVEQHP